MALSIKSVPNKNCNKKGNIMANPLTLMIPVLPNTKWEDIAVTLATAQTQIDAALLSIGTVHFARFLLLDSSNPNLQVKIANAGMPSDTLIIGVITEYDGNFNAYISDFVAQLGDVFDELLAYAVGGAALVPVKNNVAAFQAYIMENDASQHLPNTTLYEAYPQTVQIILASV
jgi:hypothetical protein